jgi:hypothetical protein
LCPTRDLFAFAIEGVMHDNGLWREGTKTMARLIRSVLVIGTIAVLSPVHEAGSLRAVAGAQSRTLLSSLMPAVSMARTVSEMDPAVREALVSAAAAQLGAVAPDSTRRKTKPDMPRP